MESKAKLIQFIERNFKFENIENWQDYQLMEIIDTCKHSLSKLKLEELTGILTDFINQLTLKD